MSNLETARQIARTVDNIIFDGFDDMCDKFDTIKREFKFSDEEIVKIVRHNGGDDLADFYEEWIREGEE